MISRITLGLMREGQEHADYGFDTCENDAIFSNSFRAAPPGGFGNGHSPKRGSATLLQHISVISRSERDSSGTGPRSLRAMRVGAPPVSLNKVEKKRRFSRIAGGRRFSCSFGFLSTDLGTISLGSFGITTSEMGHFDVPFDIEAPSISSPEVAADAAGLTVPSSASFGLSPTTASAPTPTPTPVPPLPAAAVIHERTQLTEHDAYELRTLRASHVSPTSSGVVRL